MPFYVVSLRDLLGLDASRASSFYPQSPEGDGNNIRISSQLHDVTIFSSSYYLQFLVTIISRRGSIFIFQGVVGLGTSRSFDFISTIWNLSCSSWTHHTCVFITIIIIFFFYSHMFNITVLKDICNFWFSKVMSYLFFSLVLGRDRLLETNDFYFKLGKGQKREY